jgi:dipeptidyl aminopeptidase/acylaminoacyl peptidase
VDVRAQLFKATDGAVRRPALIFAHGGPDQQMLLGWHPSPFPAVAYALNQYLAARGFLVLSVNYRRGTGYGHAFQYPDRERGAAEYDDLLAAARYLQTRPDVDPAHLGVSGVGYGGYLAAVGLARNSELFSAGVDIDGPPDLVLQEIRRLYASTTDETGERTSTVQIWTSPIMIARGDDDHTLQFREVVALERELATQGVPVEVREVPDDVRGFMLFRSWKAATAGAADYLERAFPRSAAR